MKTKHKWVGAIIYPRYVLAYRRAADFGEKTEKLERIGAVMATAPIGEPIRKPKHTGIIVNNNTSLSTPFRIIGFSRSTILIFFITF